MKIIKVDCCGNCPLKYNVTYAGGRHVAGYRCTHAEVEGMEIDKESLDKIPKWCPLEDQREVTC